MVGCTCGDSIQQSWFLGYVPWAIAHLHNPFFTTYMDYPQGVNLAANTTMPLLGVLSAPLTALYGAGASYNFLMWLAYPLSAASAYWVARRLTGSNLAAIYVGLVYGFSPYILHQGLGHLNLSFVPIPPLIVYALYRVVVRQDGRAWRSGVVLGLWVCAQYLVSSEVLVSTVIVAAAGVVVWCVVNWRQIDARRVRFAAAALAPALGVVVVILAYPVGYDLAGPYVITAPVHDGVFNPFRADLWGAIFPTRLEYFGSAALKAVGDRLTITQVDENGTYLGVPLLVLFVGVWIRYWRDRAIRVAGIVAVLAWVLSLGPWLVIDARPTTLRLPFYYLARLPLVDNLLPVRLALFETFFVALTIALGIAAWLREMRRRHETGERPSTRQRTWTNVVIVVVALSLIVRAPSLPLPSTSTRGTTPAFFTSAEATAIPSGAVILTYPFADSVFNQLPMLWQSASGWRWRMMGGYASIPGPFPTSVGSNPWPSTPLSVENYLEYWDGANLGTTWSAPVALVSSVLISQTHAFLSRYHVDAVVVDLAVPHSSQAVRLFRATLGQPVHEGGVDAWLHLRTSR
jgi:hypothetical protein